MIDIRIVATKELKELLKKEEEAILFLKLWLSRKDTKLYHSLDDVREAIKGFPTMRGWMAWVEVNPEDDEDELIALVRAFYASIDYVITIPTKVREIKKKLKDKGLTEVEVLSIEEFYSTGYFEYKEIYIEFQKHWSSLKREKYCNPRKKLEKTKLLG